MQTPMFPRWMIAAPIALTWTAIVVATVTVLQFPTTTAAQAQSVSACDSYAHNYARNRTRGHVPGSAARNALGGAIIGSLVDGRQGARQGASLGLGAGLFAGGIAANNDYERHFNSAFRRCMRI
jgi:hypothetical protein